MSSLLEKYSNYASPGYFQPGYVASNVNLEIARTAVNRLTNQFQGSEKLKNVVFAITYEMTKIDKTLADMKTQRWVDTAIGKQLDGAGYIVGEDRKGRDDDAYRAAIRFRIFVNVSKGTRLDLIRGLKFLTQPDDSQYLEQYPATAMLFTNGPVITPDIHDVIQDISPVGISDVPVMVSYGAWPFRFSRESAPAELFVNDNYMEVDGSDLQVSGQQTAVADGRATLGGLVPSDLEVSGGLLELDFGATLVVHDPNTAVTMGQYHLTGVYQ